MSNALIIAGRFLLGLYFLVPGLMKFAAPDMHVALMQMHNVPLAEPLMWLAAMANVGGGLLLIFGRHVCLTALAFVVYVLLVNVLLHDFWADHPGAWRSKTCPDGCNSVRFEEGWPSSDRGLA